MEPDNGSNSIAPVGHTYGGLTKREHFALALTAAYVNGRAFANLGYTATIAAQHGVEVADALLAQLEKERAR